MIEFTVKRSEWLRGEGNEKSKLLLPSDGKKCCLGFLALALGAKEEDISNMDAPVNASDVLWPEGLLSSKRLHSSLCTELMDINDYCRLSFKTAITASEQEDVIIKRFSEINIKVTFID